MDLKKVLCGVTLVATFGFFAGCGANNDSSQDKSKKYETFVLNMKGDISNYMVTNGPPSIINGAYGYRFIKNQETGESFDVPPFGHHQIVSRPISDTSLTVKSIRPDNLKK